MSTRAADDPCKARLLFVEDETTLARLYARVLRRSYEIVAIPSGEEALDLLRRGERFDAILSDFRLPGMSGADLFVRILELDRQLAGRVAFITGSTHDPDAFAFFQLVPNLRLTKPFDYHELLAFVAEVVRTTRK